MSLLKDVLNKLKPKQPFTVANIFTNIPKVSEYHVLPTDVKTFVETVITNGLKSNKNARVKRAIKVPLQQDFWQLPYETIVQLRTAVENMDLETVFTLVYGITEKEVNNMELFNCFACYQWVTDQLLEINKVEKECLGDEPSIEQKNAGVEELEQFGYANSLDMLAGGDILKYDAILLMPYAVIFRKLYMEKVKQEIHKRYLEYVSRKTKRNS